MEVDMSKKVLLLFSLALIASSMLLSGCKSKKEKEEEYKRLHKDDPTTLAQMNDKQIYILRQDGTCQPLYFGPATFNQGSTEDPADERFFYLKDEEFMKIPTFNAETDKLIMKSSGTFSEDFSFERFEYLGYTIGLVNPKSKDSGRVSISINPSDKTTLPGTDTSKLLELYKKDTLESLTIDSLGGRTLKALDASGNIIELTNRTGTFKDLDPNARYEAKIYAGTKKYDYIFVSNIQILASMDRTTTLNYEYDDTNNFVEISIPHSFHVGFYTVNGQGLMRYVPSGYRLTANTDYNIPNDNSKEVNAFTYTISDGDKYKEYQSTGKFIDTGGEEVYQNTSAMTADQYIERTFTIENRGYYHVEVEVSAPRANDPNLSIIVITPAGEKHQLVRDKSNPYLYTTNFYAHITGSQCIRYYGIGMRAAKCNVSPISKEDTEN